MKKKAVSRMIEMRTSKGENKMGKFVYIIVRLYFKILDSEVYGGDGSVGYSEFSVEGDVENDNRTVNLSDDFIKEQIHFMAHISNVPVEKVKLISKEEYEANTECD